MKALDGTDIEYIELGYFLAFGSDGRIIATMFEDLPDDVLRVERLPRQTS